MATIIAFDVNETLLDLRSLDPYFEELLGSAALRPQWFAQMLQLSFVGGLTGHYVDFTTAQKAALRMVVARQGKSVSDQVVDALVEQMTLLPPHREVPNALAELAATELTVVALVNSVQSVGESQLVNAGVRHHFDRVISADSVRSLKPAPKPYLAVASAYGTDVSEVRVVAAHSWDVTGALSAGCRAAFVARPGMVLSPIGPRPDIVAKDIADVVKQIKTVDKHIS